MSRRKIFRHRAGFTVFELLVASVVLIILSSVVLARFRTHQTSGDRNIALKQIIDGITATKTMSLGGKILTNQSVPDGGYGIHFDTTTSPAQFNQFAVITGVNQLLANTTVRLPNITMTALCGSTNASVTTAPCQGSDWQNVGSTEDIVFTLSGLVSATTPVVQSWKYVGGVITDNQTGQRAYFYVSLQSGLVTGKQL